MSFYFIGFILNCYICDLLLQLTTPGYPLCLAVFKRCAAYSSLLNSYVLANNNYFAEYALCKEGISMANLVNPSGPVGSTSKRRVDRSSRKKPAAPPITIFFSKRPRLGK